MFTGALDPMFILALALGTGAHLLTTLIEESSKAGRRITLTEFEQLHPYQLTLSLILSIAAYIIFFRMNELNVVSAFSAGYIGDSLVKKAMGKVHLKAGK